MKVVRSISTVFDLADVSLLVSLEDFPGSILVSSDYRLVESIRRRMDGSVSAFTLLELSMFIH